MDVKELGKHGQSLWLDSVRRDLLSNGELARLVREDGVRGVTTNPSTLEEAIAEGTDYDASLARYVARRDESASSLYERLSVEDLQAAADILKPLYYESERRDGYVSMEVSPRWAHDTWGTIEEGRRLWARVHRENLMIEIPGTAEAMPAIEALTAEGINVNTTLLFSRSARMKAAESYMSGLEILAGRRGTLARVASVATMFVSRIDDIVDEKLSAQLTTHTRVTEPLRALLGKAAIANAKLAYQDWKETCKTARWQSLVNHGANPQRLAWAGTGTETTRFRDLLYVESLVGPDTVDTIPLSTLTALRHHGRLGAGLEDGLEEAREVFMMLAKAGISLDEIGDRLLEEGIVTYASAFDGLMASIEKKRADVLSRIPPARRSSRPPPTGH
jgi:transaldolase/glucose-6-phosphate isomerase